MDTELRGLDYGGLARTLSIFERTTKLGYTRGPIEIVHETPLSALVDGRNTIGYLVARFASDLCIEKASTQGMAVVGARDTWHTGMLSFFAEMAAERDLVTMIASNAAPNTALRRDGRPLRHQSDLFRVSIDGQPSHLGHRNVQHHAW